MWRLWKHKKKSTKCQKQKERNYRDWRRTKKEEEKKKKEEETAVEDEGVTP